MANFEHPSAPDDLVGIVRHDGSIGVAPAGEWFPGQNPAKQADIKLAGPAPIEARLIDAPDIKLLGAPAVDAELHDPVDAALRARVPQPPLNREEIGRIAAHRGQPVTQEQIDGMNASRARGLHTSIV